MSTQDPTPPFPAAASYPAFEAPPLPEDDYIDDDEEWVNQAPKGLRIPALTGVLLLILFAVSGFWGGAILQKHHDKGKTSTATSAFAAAAAARRAGGGTGGFAGFGGGAGGAAANRTLGTVSYINGTVVTLTNAAGNAVTVNLSPSTKITQTSSATPADLQLGQSLIVTGTGTAAPAAGAPITAASITIVPAGTALGGAGGAGTGGTGTGAGG